MKAVTRPFLTSRHTCIIKSIPMERVRPLWLHTEPAEINLLTRRRFRSFTDTRSPVSRTAPARPLPHTNGENLMPILPLAGASLLDTKCSRHRFEARIECGYPGELSDPHPTVRLGAVRLCRSGKGIPFEKCLDWPGKPGVTPMADFALRLQRR